MISITTLTINDMSNYATLIASIQSVITQNGNNEITGTILQQTLLSMINSLGSGYQFVGIAEPSTNPGTPDQRVFYLASSGTYPNFGPAIIPAGNLAVLYYDTSWHYSLCEISAKFASGEEVNETHIDDTNLNNPQIGSLTKATDAMQVKQSCRETSIFETKLSEYSIVTGRSVGGATGLLTSSTSYRSYIYDISNYKYYRFSAWIVPSDSNSVVGYSITDINDDLSTTTNANVLFCNTYKIEGQTEIYGTVPTGAKWLKITVKNPSSLDYDVYCYGGVGVSQSNFAKRFTNLIGNEIDFNEYKYYSGSISTSSGFWSFSDNNPSYCKFIPIPKSVKSITITGSAQNNSIIAFLSSINNKAKDLTPHIAVGLTGSHGLITMGIGETTTFIVCNGANYLYVQNNNSFNRTPQKIVFNTAPNSTYNYRERLEAVSVTDNNYISVESFENVSNNSYKIVSFNVSNLKCIGIKARVPNLGTCVFYDSSNNIVGLFAGAYGTDVSVYNFDDVIVVPSNATTLKVSVYKNLPFLVADCSGLGYELDPRNMLTAKKVSFVGDSITYGYGLSNQSDRWSTVFSRSLARCRENNLGVSGSCLCSNTKNRTKYDDPINADRFITRVTQETIGDSDVIFIWGGTNDFSYDSKPIGDLFTLETITGNTYKGNQKRVAPSDTDTFAGALHELLSTVRAINPTAKVVYLTIMNRGSFSGWAADNQRPTSFEKNANGNWIDEYNDAIYKICDFYAVPVVDINNLLNQNWAYDASGNYQSLDLDGIHPNAAGHRRIAEIVFNYITYNHLV